MEVRHSSVVVHVFNLHKALGSIPIPRGRRAGAVDMGRRGTELAQGGGGGGRGFFKSQPYPSLDQGPWQRHASQEVNWIWIFT
jgi:hypothetical protein